MSDTILMRTRCLILIVVLVLFVGPVWANDSSASEEASDPEPMLAMGVTMQVIAGDPEASGERLAEFAESHGGYFTYRSLDSVVLRIPAEHVAGLRREVGQLGDTIITYNPSMYDYTEEYLNLEAAVTSRREALDQILQYVETANVTATLAFERELRSLSQEIDAYTGRQRAIVNEVRYASVTVGLTTRQSTIPDKIPSSFGWINTIDLYRFVDEIRYLGAQ